MVKNILILVCILAMSASMKAQSPQALSFQALVRDASNQIVTNSSVGVQISVLQGAANGSSVYTETHSLTTNSNGILTTQIGTGNVVSGDFSTIDWSAGPYFVQTEIDPTGGTTYTITNTTQMLSVPYALYASNANSATMLGNSITKAHFDDLDQRLAAIEPAPAIGDFRYGGSVFWIDPTNPEHGVVVSMENLNNNATCKWSTGANQVTGATGSAIGTGETNTAAIIAAHGEGNYAASVCASYTYGIYSGWFLPSPNECYEVYLNIAVVNPAITANGGTAVSGLYWTSKESSQSSAATKYMTSAGGGGSIKGNTYKIRAIRAF